MERYKRLDILIMQKNKLLENQDSCKVPAADVTMMEINNTRIRNEQGGKWNRLTESPESPQELRIKQLEV